MSRGFGDVRIGSNAGRKRMSPTTVCFVWKQKALHSFQSVFNVGKSFHASAYYERIRSIEQSRGSTVQQMAKTFAAENTKEHHIFDDKIQRL